MVFRIPIHLIVLQTVSKYISSSISGVTPFTQLSQPNTQSDGRRRGEDLVSDDMLGRKINEAKDKIIARAKRDIASGRGVTNYTSSRLNCVTKIVKNRKENQEKQKPETNSGKNNVLRDTQKLVSKKGKLKKK